jgi:hypothetical protein
MSPVPPSIEQVDSAGPDMSAAAELSPEQVFSIRHRGLLPWLLAACVLLGAFLIDNHRIVTGKDAPTWDAYAFYAAEYTLVADHARAGRLLVWNPWASGGEPDFAEPQIGAASPIAVLMGAITGGTETGFRVYWIFIWFLGPLGVMLLARYLKVAPWAAFVIALGFAFSGFYLGHAEHTTFIYSFSWLPWIFWRLDVALSYSRFRAAAEAGALWGLSALGGYPALTILTWGFLALWVLGRSVLSSDDAMHSVAGSARQRLQSAALSILVFSCVGVVVLAPTYVAFFKEGIGYSERAGGITRELAVASNASAPGSFLTFSSPYLGTLKFPWWNPSLWWGTDGSGVNNYIGVLPILLALLALALRPKSHWRWWLLGIIVFACCCAVGPHLPVRGWLYDYCPPTRYFRHPEIFRAYGMFVASVLAMLAARDFSTSENQASSHFWRRFLLVSMGATACAFLAYLYVITHVANLGDQIQRSNWHVVGAWLVALAVPTLAIAFPTFRRWLPALLVIVAIADASVTIRLCQRFVSDHVFARQKWDKINAEHTSTLDLTSNDLKRQPRPPAWVGGTNQNTNVPLRIATLFNDFAANNRFHVDYEHHPVLVDMSTGSNRIWFAKKVVIAPPSDQIYKALVSRSTAIGAPVLVVHPAGQMQMISDFNSARSVDVAKASAVSELAAAERISTQVLRYMPNYLELRVTAPDQGWVLITDRWASGWHVRINGVTQEIFGGNFIFRAVPVRAGENTIQFSYPHKGYLVLVLFSWGILAALLILFPTRSWLRRRWRTVSELET